jgi:hypothetical protein
LVRLVSQCFSQRRHEGDNPFSVLDILEGYTVYAAAPLNYQGARITPRTGL